MSLAWETTADDVYNVMRTHNVVDETMNLRGRAEKEFDDLDEEDHSRIEEAALRGDDMDEQTNYAYDEIEDILAEKGIISEQKLFSV
jgi:hypothetical protein